MDGWIKDPRETGCGGIDWIYLAQDSDSEHGNKPPGSIKCWQVLEKLRDQQLLKKGSVP
jgi:hypothetical protein